jgi:hypothetical protein
MRIPRTKLILNHVLSLVKIYNNYKIEDDYSSIISNNSVNVELILRKL